jgi:hypothetical protein
MRRVGTKNSEPTDWEKLRVAKEAVEDADIRFTAGTRKTSPEDG